MARTLWILILALICTELAVLQFSDWKTEVSPWLFALFDASVMAAVGAVVVYFAVQYQIGSRAPQYMEWLAIKVGCLLFAVDLLIMLVVSQLTEGVAPVLESMIDIAIVAIVVPFFINKYVFIDVEDKPAEARRVRANPAPKLVVLYISLGILLLFVLVASYDQQKNDHIQETINSNQIRFETIESALVEKIYNAALDVSLLASLPVFDQFETGNRQQIDTIAHYYENFAAVKEFVHQVRFIALNGDEVVKIVRNNANSQPLRIANQFLQNKSRRYYFQEGNSLKPGEMYLSQLDLNVEFGEVELPFRPVLRLATKAVDQSGNEVGLVVLNLNASELLADFNRFRVSMSGDLVLLNQAGYWLAGGGDKNWSFMFAENAENNLNKQEPELWEYMQNQPDSFGYIDLDSGFHIFKKIGQLSSAQGITRYYSRQIADHLILWPQWTILNSISSDQIDSPLFNLRLFMVVIFLVIMGLLGGFFYLFYHAVMRQKLVDNELRHLALHDHLTGLANRRSFLKRINFELQRSRRTDETICLMIIDLDDFKPINDQYGHQTGDYVLKTVALRLSKCFRESDLVARVGGDEFAVILPEAGTKQIIELIAERVLEEISRPIRYKTVNCSVGATIGAHMVTDFDQSVEELLNAADTALYKGKRTKKNSLQFA